MSKRKPKRRNFVLSVAAGALAQGCYAASGNSPDAQNSPPPGSVVNVGQPPVGQVSGLVATPVGLVPPPIGKVITPYDAGQNNPDLPFPGMLAVPADAGKPDASQHVTPIGSIAFPGVVARPPDAGIDEDAG